MTPEAVGAFIGAVIATITGVAAVQERRNRAIEPKMEARDENIQTMRRKVQDLEYDIRSLTRDVDAVREHLKTVLTLWAGYMSAKGETLPSEIIRLTKDQDDQ